MHAFLHMLAPVIGLLALLPVAGYWGGED
jgi:hypothetical protein